MYKLNIFIYGFYLIPFAFLLILTAWSVGFFVTGLILRYSTKVQTLAWSLIAVLSPFTGIYYSISILPIWAQKVSLIVPTSYVFEAMREVATKGYVTGDKLYISLILNLVYFVLAVIYFRQSFKVVLQKGLVKVF